MFFEPELFDLYFEVFFNDLRHIKEIDHIPNELFIMNLDCCESVFENQLVLVNQDYLAISFEFFDYSYLFCQKEIFSLKKIEKLDINKANLLLKYSRILLCLNGENGTVINARKKLLKEGFINNLFEELHFVGLLCKKFKKSSAVWNYRFDLIKIIIGNAKINEKESKYEEKKIQTENCINLEEIFNAEHLFLEEILNKFPRNYFAWTHRNLLFQEIFPKINKKNNFLENELCLIHKYCEKHIHEYSAFHYLSFLINNYSEKHDLISENIWIQELINIYQQAYGEDQKELKKLVSLHEFEKFLNKLKNNRLK